MSSTGPALSLVRDPCGAHEFTRWIEQLHPDVPVGLDTETDGRGKARDQTLRTVQFGDTAHGFTIPADEFRGHIRYALELLALRRNPVAIHNAMFDLEVLQSAGLPLPARSQTFDTMLLALHEDNTRPAGLKELVDIPHLSALDFKLREIFRKSSWTWADIPISHPVYWRYAAYDPIANARLFERLPSAPAYADDFTFNEVLRAAYRRGILIDHEFREPAIQALEDNLEQHLAVLQDHGLTRPSEADVGAELEKVLGRTLPRTSKGHISTSKDALSEIDHPAVASLLAWRAARSEATKVRSWLDSDRLRPVLRPWSKDPDSDKARTGRCSTIDPNLQAFTGTDKGPLRSCLVPDADFQFVAVDYSNQELRLLAHYTGDEGLKGAFSSGQDIHSYVAGEAGIPRSAAKTFNFALPYGAGDDNLASTLGCTRDELHALKRKLSDAFPGLVGFADRYSGQDVTTIGGRTLRPDPDRPYTSGNYLLQGSGADVLKTAVSRCEAAGYADWLCATVHDEFLFSVPVGENPEQLREVLERHDIDPPLTVSVSAAVDRWGSAK